MFGVATAFAGGYYVKQAFDKVPLPSLQRRQDTSPSFKLSVRVVAAAAPALQEPGFWSRQRPRLEVSLGNVQKDTEFADFVRSDQAIPSAGACARECPWRFGDSLTFVANLKDVAGHGLRLRLRAHSDFSVGPLQLQLASVAELGEAAVDLRRRVLPACVRSNSSSSDVWESPVLLIPFTHVRGGVVSADHDIGQATAHVALVFSLNADPEAILSQVEPVSERRNIGDVFASRADHVIRWLEEPIDMSKLPGSGVMKFPESDASDFAAPAQHAPGHGAVGYAGGAVATLTPMDAKDAAERASVRASSVEELRTTLKAPDLAPEGWVSRKGPNGKVFWHHKALGPAPWEDAAGQPLPSARSVSFGPIVSPELPEGSWVSHQGQDGRLFWHNTALGPPPWTTNVRSAPVLRDVNASVIPGQPNCRVHFEQRQRLGAASASRVV
eukprot:TRINITY_DN56889_c0_g1_i1.p1 TRINITY_DN56889_c0_g1~~TRINITY_DN56889_c0_g1_i1.p1  ORF type:complete len:441 (-),score=48.69 TRINITY_DN56889_c0_g1_i1:325-1647(-)